jgi:hypothetical protein
MSMGYIVIVDDGDVKMKTFEPNRCYFEGYALTTHTQPLSWHSGFPTPPLRCIPYRSAVHYFVAGRLSIHGIGRFGLSWTPSDVVDCGSDSE